MPFQKGYIPWNKGKKMTTEYGLNISRCKKGKLTKVSRKGPNNTVRCGMCREYKRKDQFHSNKRRIDGVDGRCKECRKTLNHIAKLQARERRKRLKNKTFGNIKTGDKYLDFAIDFLL